MNDGAREAAEQGMRELCAAGDHASAATVALRAYGPELFAFLHAMISNDSDASDVFAETSEALWRSLPSFAWQCSLRTWAYAIARNQMRNLARGALRSRRRGKNVGASALDDLAQAVRTETLAYLRTEPRTRFQELRDALPEEDRMLLTLRIDRQLSWNDLARVLGAEDGDAPLSGPELTRESARLRQRFQTVKTLLRAEAKKAGLIG